MFLEDVDVWMFDAVMEVEFGCRSAGSGASVAAWEGAREDAQRRYEREVIETRTH